LWSRAPACASRSKGNSDQGLVANLQLGALLAVVGGVLATVWLAVNRRWTRRRDAAAPLLS
jgi:drug/metabolite transporter (DMT)-like permease